MARQLVPLRAARPILSGWALLSSTGLTDRLNSWHVLAGAMSKGGGEPKSFGRRISTLIRGNPLLRALGLAPKAALAPPTEHEVYLEDQGVRVLAVRPSLDLVLYTHGTGLTQIVHYQGEHITHGLVSEGLHRCFSPLPDISDNPTETPECLWLPITMKSVNDRHACVFPLVPRQPWKTPYCRIAAHLGLTAREASFFLQVRLRS
jgi:hypothetical protein